jgi:hypothetical protein
MAQQNDFRKLSNFNLRSVFISLGLPESSFKDPTSPGRNGLGNVVALNADPSRPDTLWLFRGSKYFVFNLLRNRMQNTLMEGSLRVRILPAVQSEKQCWLLIPELYAAIGGWRGLDAGFVLALEELPEREPGISAYGRQCGPVYEPLPQSL